MRRSITAYWLGRIGYARAHALQKLLVEERAHRGPRDLGDVILLLEHEPVVTLGRGAKPENILAGDEDLAARGVSVVETGRGGDVTFHGPGQLVAYPIVDLRPERCDVRRYVQDLEDVMISLARDHGVVAGLLPGSSKLVGVWVDELAPGTWDEARSLRTASGEDASGTQRLAKVGAIGVRLSHWVTMHGFALNVSTDLAGFRLIVPCGIGHLGVTSLQAIAALTGGGPVPTVAEMAQRSLPHFARVLDADVVMGDVARIAALLE
ncbi:MAG: Octanoate-[acyl-carrier-protein]-protein-N-octanoyltransferase [Labilithrix sp.]|nr:Octanoate-[acyl-carrier-protein]-protein-N-octanoyltransferase [Labilithrix sp.]